MIIENSPHLIGCRWGDYNAIITQEIFEMAAEAVLSIKWQKCVFLIFSQIITYEMNPKQLLNSGSVIILNKNLDFVSVFIHR